MSTSIHHEVQQYIRNDQRAVAVEQLRDIDSIEEYTGGNDEDVDKHNHLPQRDVFVFVDNSCNDVRAACRAVGEKDDAQADTFAGRSEDGTHKRVLPNNLWHILIDNIKLSGVGHTKVDHEVVS